MYMQTLLSQWAVLPIQGMAMAADYRYMYELHVFTGFQKHAGTDSEVHMVLIGITGDTGDLLMNDGQRKV